MAHTTSSHSENHNTRYVEYVDVFAREEVTPSAALKENLLLFDTFDGTNPLAFLHQKEAFKMYQTINIFVTNGEFTLIINEKEESVAAGTLITIMPENTIRIKTASADFGYFMTVTYPKLANLLYNDIGFTYSSARLSLRHFIAPMSEEQTLRNQRLYNDIKRDIIGPNYEFKESYIRSLLAAMMIEIINIQNYIPMPLQGNSNSRQYDVYSRFLALLNKHSIEHRSVSHYAKTLGISSKYLSFVCISYSKKNASSWIDESVIQKAKALLLVHHYTFSEASETLHFPTVSSFSRFFKRVTGLTPKEFVRQNS